MYNFPDDFYAIDIGMHDGKDSEYYAKRGFRVIAFEANTSLIPEAKNRLLSLQDNVEIRNLAISDVEGDIEFHVNKERTQWSSIDPEIASRGHQTEIIRVKGCDLSVELQDIQNRIHMLKIDIEGFDLVALKQVAKLAHKPKYISVENGGEKFIEVLSDMGYTRYKYSNQKYTRFHVIPKNSEHGRTVNHKFQDHSSGAFGNDLIGRWLTLGEAIRVTKALDAARSAAPNNLFAESVGWFDLHATE